jgi:V8-like Glu-specific endopeptidase
MSLDAKESIRMYSLICKFFCNQLFILFLLSLLLPEALLAEPILSQESARYSVDKIAETVELRGGAFDQKPISFSIDLNSPDKTEIEDLQTKNAAGDLPLQIGIGRNLDATQKQPLSEQDIKWETIEGGFIGRLQITSLDARAIRALLIFSEIDSNTEIRFFGEGAPKTIYGPFGKDDLVKGYAEEKTETGIWSPVLEGETIGIEIFTPQIKALEFRMESISHLLYSVSNPKTEDLLNLKGIGDSGTCNLDMVCYSAWDLESDAVAKLIYQNGATSYLCTGSLLNDTDTTSWIPYLMTANHCISTQTVASTLTSFWFYTSNACNSGVLSGSSQQLTGGAAMLSTGYENDYTMLRLNSSPPGGVTFLGWNAYALASGASVTGIHNPSGDLQKISFGTSQGFANVRDTNSHIKVVWSSGTTEGGSSGSALLNSSKQFTGQLTGGNASCAAPTQPDYYGRFDQYYSVVSSWLTATGPTDDNYEENDSLVAAFDLHTNENTWLSSIDGLGIQSDDDYYQILVTPGNEHLIADLTFTHAEGDIDISLLNAAGSLIAGSFSITDNEQIDTIVPTAGTYYLLAHYGNAGNTYNLRWGTQSTIPNGCYTTAFTLTDVTFPAASTNAISSEDMIATLGTVIAESASNLTLTATNGITLNPGFHAQNGSLFSASIAPVNCP